MDKFDRKRYFYTVLVRFKYIYLGKKMKELNKSQKVLYWIVWTLIMLSCIWGIKKLVMAII